MKPFTVVLLLPDYRRDDGNETYIAFNFARDAKDAAHLAKTEAQNALEEGEGEMPAEDFALLVVFEGHCKVARYGFEGC